ncbi:21 kDa protein-like [Magnolia sinica]|uniref:21 kDa protein-like n=1 Tax=Magnolia sinica TaxID=86752 RepID=UPI00265AF414|nr:21 kDa protein-like [Magnolia sinica]
MAKYQLLALFSAVLFFAGLSQVFSAVYFQDHADTSTNTSTNATDFIRTSCSATLYPERCYASLSRYANAIQQSPSQLALVAVSVSLRRARRTASYVASLQRAAAAGDPPADARALAALRDCKSTFGDAIDLMRSSLDELRQLKTGETFRWQMGNVETWMSAALTNEDTCTDGFQAVAPGPMKSDISARVASAEEVTSNALALVNSLASKEGNAAESSEAVYFEGRGF